MGGLASEIVDRLHAMGGTVAGSRRRAPDDQAARNRWSRYAWANTHVLSDRPEALPFGAVPIVDVGAWHARKEVAEEVGATAKSPGED